MRWRLYIEEYSPDLRYVKGGNNTVADVLSRLEIASEPMEEAFFSEELRAELYYYGAETFSAADYPLNYGLISQAQLKNKKLLKQKAKKDSQYKSLTVTAADKDIPMICHQGKIVIPETLQSQVVDW